MRPSRVVKEFVACVGRGLESISLRWEVAALPFSKSYFVSCEGGCGKGFLAHTMSHSPSSQRIRSLQFPPSAIRHSRTYSIHGEPPTTHPLFRKPFAPQATTPLPTHALHDFFRNSAPPSWPTQHSPNCPCAFRPVPAHRHNTHAHSGRQIFGAAKFSTTLVVQNKS